MGGHHGYGRYSNGCRCPICRAAKADYMRRRRADARQLAAQHTVTIRIIHGGDLGLDAWLPGTERHYAQGVTHGTRSAYDEGGCRCRACTTARTESDRRYRLKEAGQA